MQDKQSVVKLSAMTALLMVAKSLQTKKQVRNLS